MSDQRDSWDENRIDGGSGGDTDMGVPVGDADVEADIERASGDGGSDGSGDDLDQGSVEPSTDQGVPVGSADVEADRQRAGGSTD